MANIKIMVPIEIGVIVAVIIGLVQVLKMSGLPSQFAALAAIVIGVAAAFFVAPAATIGLTVFNGILYGLSASGFYSGTRSTIGI